MMKIPKRGILAAGCETFTLTIFLSMTIIVVLIVFTIEIFRCVEVEKQVESQGRIVNLDMTW